MRKLHCIVLIAFLVSSLSSAAQSVVEQSFQEVLEKMPKPPVDFQEAVNAYGALYPGELPAEFKSAQEEMNQTKKQLLTSLFEKFQAALARTKTDKAYRAALSPEEQKMVRDFATLQASWGTEAFYGFSAWIEYRPGIGKQSWTKITQPLSATGQGYYQQLLQLEKQLNWKSFMEEVHEQESLLQSYPKVDELNQQLGQELSAVPTRKVKMFEGSDVMADLQDADKAIAVLKKFDVKMRQAYKQAYDEKFKWWNACFNQIRTVALKMDNLLTTVGYGSRLNGNDQQLLPVIADVQARVVGMLYHLIGIGAKVVAIAPQSKVSSVMVEESISSFKKMSSQ